MNNEALTVKCMQSQFAILLKVGESENVFTFHSTMCHIFMQIIIFYPWSPAGLWVGGNEVEDKTNHNPSSHDDTSIGQEGGVHCKQTWNKEYFISFLHSLHNYCRKFSINNNKASHSKINHFPCETGFVSGMKLNFEIQQSEKRCTLWWNMINYNVSVRNYNQIDNSNWHSDFT